MRTESVSYEGTVTSFISSGGPESTDDYNVYVRSTAETHRVRVSKDGTMSACARDVSNIERAAVTNYIAIKQAEYIAWKAEFDRKYA